MIIGIAILAACLTLLLVPVDVRFRFEGADKVCGEVRVQWLFGLVGTHITLPRPGDSKHADVKRSLAPKPTARRSLLKLLGQSPFRRRALRLLKHLINAIHVMQLSARVRLGLGDPAETGRLYTVLWLLHTAARRRGVDLSIETDFVSPVLDYDAHGRLLLIPLPLLALIVAFALSPSSLQAWRQLRTRPG